MANSTARIAKNIHGTNPQFLIERVIRGRIYDSTYWKEHCFALTAESLIDKAIGINYIGGTYGIQRPTNYICLVCKLLQIQPEKDIILEYLRYEEFKYLRAIAALYVRLTFSSLEIYEILEPMLNDYRKLRFREMSGSYYITYMDDFIYDLLNKDRVCELILPRMTRRDVLEEMEGLAPRISKLENALFAVDDQNSDGEASDDSAAFLRSQKKARMERAIQVREEKQKQKLNRQRAAFDTALQDRIEDDLQVIEYPSQEEEESEIEGDRYISPTPSQSGSKDRYQSRSPSRSPDRIGYISRSVSRSPDR